ncbi:hypothetical protein BX667DRAFT_178281 [Coemansia mojavensis]|nr:hypothetical protein BX667DRAFT_178281 [Coemansia mojavensis]
MAAYIIMHPWPLLAFLNVANTLLSALGTGPLLASVSVLLITRLPFPLTWCKINSTSLACSFLFPRGTMRLFICVSIKLMLNDLGKINVSVLQFFKPRDLSKVITIVKVFALIMYKKTKCMNGKNQRI